ncbi:PAS domain S-box protein [Rubrivirga sp. IMCC43871]|uniref:sensor histidine kinase n=1 Tax=Rubrivirga sp. IMCC43871 TaxID=3391575 RepID=UPI00399029DC
MAPPETLFVDAAFRITGVTPGIEACLPLGVDDLGRDLDEALSGYGWLLDDIRTALAGGDAAPSLHDGAARRQYRFSARPMTGGGAVVTMIDETDRVANEARLAQSNAEFRALVEASGQVVWRTDERGEVVRGGPELEPFATGDTNAWLQQNWTGDVHPDDAVEMAARWAEAVRGRTAYQAEFRIRDSETGGWRWVAERGVPITAQDGAFLGHIGIHTDIDDARRATEALRASERRFRALVGASAETVWECDAEGLAIGDSPSWRAFTGQTLEEWQGMGWLAAVHPDDRAGVAETWGATIEAGADYHHEFRVRRASDGEWRWMVGRAVPLLDADGAVEGYMGMNVDVTEQHAAAEAIRVSERRFRALIEASAETVWEADAEGNVLSESSGWEATTGQSLSEYAGYGWLEAVHPDDGGPMAEAWRAATAAGLPFEREFRIRRASDGEWRWTRSRAVPLFDADGAVEGYIGTTTDIADQRGAEEALRASERRFRALIEASSETVWESDAEGRVVGDSDVWQTLTGHTSEEREGIGWLAAVHPDDLPGVLEAWTSIVETGADGDFEFRIRRVADGGWRRVVSHVAPLLDADGVVEGYVGMDIDVTERHAASEALHASEARFRAMAETVPDVLFTVEETGEVSYVSSAGFAETAGLAADELMTVEDWMSMAHPDDAEPLLAAWTRALETGESFEFRYRSDRGGGRYRWVIVRARLVASDDGWPPRWYGAATDIDDLARAEVALTEANETLEARVRAETDRVRHLSAALAVAEESERRRIADVLHDDLQQQLYGLALLVSRLQSDPSSDERTSLLLRCDAIIEEATTIARGLATDLAPPALDSHDACDLARWLAGETERLHGLVVDVEVDDGVDGPCLVPELPARSLMYRTLRELLFNVAKHADVDRACLRVAVEAGWLRIEVEDDGRGFETETTDHGYGLASIRERLAVAGGRLEVASAPGAGTCIRLAIPTDGGAVRRDQGSAVIGRT